MHAFIPFAGMPRAAPPPPCPPPPSQPDGAKGVSMPVLKYQMQQIFQRV